MASADVAPTTVLVLTTNAISRGGFFTDVLRSHSPIDDELESVHNLLCNIGLTMLRNTPS